ncbi:MAG TPA: hypothetical protein PKY77_00785 [Phycisphaerae bacterium]|nr:hypothetical protein [Phycisphaerae bacterium]HRY67610.1 hypothetical protein [Phycisphaerae bacterium]HSA24997.1 hypothetical protein [Phycisphaerae bacterium]
MVTLSTEPLFSGWLWLGLAALGVVVLGWYGSARPAGMSWRRWVGMLAMMAVGLGVVLALLLNPVWVEEVPPPEGKPLLTVLVDSSASMATVDGLGGKSRYDEGVALAARLARELAGGFDVRVRAFADRVMPIEAPAGGFSRADGPLTDLVLALDSGLDEECPQGQAMVLISDGIHNAGGGANAVLGGSRRAKAMAVPVYCRTIGGDAEVRDLSVELLSPQELAFAEQRVTLAARVRQRGMVGARTVVALRLEGAEIERKEVVLAASEPEVVGFDVSRPQSGLYRYEVRVEPLLGEATAANNVGHGLLRVVSVPIRVLFIEGKPYWDGKFLVRSLASDPLVDLDSVVRLSPERFVWQVVSVDRARLGGPPAGLGPSSGPADGASAPRMRSWRVVSDGGAVLGGPEGLKGYQVVVVGRDAEPYFSEAGLENLRDWIAREGGALVCSRGCPVAEVNQRLAKLLPVEWLPGGEARFHLQLTDQGRDLGWLSGSREGEDAAGLPDLPALATAARVARTKPLASVLATASGGAEVWGRPAISYQPYGVGRVVVIEGVGMWRWAFLPPPYQDEEGFYGILWHNLLRWLACGEGLLPGESLVVRSEKLSYTTAEVATALLRVRDSAGAAPTVELLAEGRAEARAFTPVAIKGEPDVFRVVFGRLLPGGYRIRAGRAAGGRAASETVFVVSDPIDEPLDLKARPELMARVAELSGGAVLTEASPDEVVTRFRADQSLTRAVTVRRTTAWDRWWVLLAILVLWGTSWRLRRSSGLI